MSWSELILVFFVLNIVQAKLSNIPSNLLSLFDAYFSYLKILEIFNKKTLNEQTKGEPGDPISVDIQSIEFEKLNISIEGKQIISALCFS